LTSLSQARCCAVRFGEVKPGVASEGTSPLSSATTSFQIATNGGSASAVNGEVPPRGQTGLAE